MPRWFTNGLLDSFGYNGQPLYCAPAGAGACIVFTNSPAGDDAISDAQSDVERGGTEEKKQKLCVTMANGSIKATFALLSSQTHSGSQAIPTQHTA